jgi:uncharacterized membrane protein
MGEIKCKWDLLFVSFFMTVFVFRLGTKRALLRGGEEKAKQQDVRTVRVTVSLLLADEP